MSDEITKGEVALLKVEQLRRQWKAASRGRGFYVGNMVRLDGALGVIVQVNQGAKDPTASTVDVRLNDGTVVEGVKVSSKNLMLYRA